MQASNIGYVPFLLRRSYMVSQVHPEQREIRKFG
jgi:hypothetical protein